jgi:hypothetical protein
METPPTPESTENEQELIVSEYYQEMMAELAMYGHNNEAFKGEKQQ